MKPLKKLNDSLPPPNANHLNFPSSLLSFSSSPTYPQSSRNLLSFSLSHVTTKKTSKKSERKTAGGPKFIEAVKSAP